MKRIASGLCVFAAVLALLCGSCLATDGYATFAVANVTRDGVIRTVTVSWVGGSSTGAVPSYSSDSVTVSDPFGATLTDAIRGYYILDVETKPGSPAPTSYGATFKDALTLDYFGGAVATRSTTAPENVNVGTTSTGFKVIRGAMTLAVTGNSTRSGVGTIVLTLLYAGVTP